MHLYSQMFYFHILFAGTTDESQYESFVTYGESLVGDAGLNLLINNAAVLARERTLDEALSKSMINNFTTNSVAPLMLTRVSAYTILAFS